MNNLCRACLSPNEALKLFDESSIVDYNLLTSLSVELNDGLPQSLCSNCWTTVDTLKTFRDNCISSENSLIHMVLNNGVINNIKIEIPIDSIKTEENGLVKIEQYADTPATISNFDDGDYDNDVDIKPCLLSKELDVEKITKSTKQKRKRQAKDSTTKSNKSTKISLIDKFNCGLCYEVYNDKNALNEHLNEHKSNLLCLICRMQFKSWLELFAHRFKHLDDNEKFCHICQQRFGLEISMLNHYILDHNDKKMTEFKCHWCNRMWETRRQLNRHIVSHEKQNFICDHCGRSCKNKIIMKKHLETHFPPKYKCTICKMKFKNRLTLKNHKLRDHDSDKIQCAKCYRYFETELKRIKHKCSEARLNICETCGAGVTTKRYSAHMRSHAGVLFECPLCPTKVKTRQSFLSHMSKHEGKPAFKCDYCSKQFYSSSAISRHKMIHTGTKPYKCKVCCKAFTKNHNLKVHMKVHGVLMFKDPEKDTKK